MFKKTLRKGVACLIVLGMALGIGWAEKPTETKQNEIKEQEKLVDLLTNKDRVIQEKAKKDLILLQEKAIPVLKELLNDEDWYKRFQVVDVLGEIKGTVSSNLLLKVALEDEKYGVGLLALRGLRDRKVKIDETTLIKLLKKYYYHELAIGLVREDTTDNRIVNLLIEGMFAENIAWQTKRDIARKIGNLHKIDPELRAKSLFEMIKRECETPTSIETGGDEGGPIDYSGLQHQYLYPLTYGIGTSTIPFLKEAFNKEKDKKVKEWIVIALGNLKDKSTVPFLKKALDKEKDDKVKERIIIALGNLEDKEVFFVLLDMAINAKDERIRAEVASCLGNFGDKKAIPILKKALKDPFYEEKGGCVRAPRGYEYMNIHYPVRQSAYFSLIKLGVKIKQKGTGANEYHEYEIIEK
jgi:HEAT repeat protein